MKLIDRVIFPPVIGMPVTVCVGGDRYTGTIAKVSKSGRTFWYLNEIHTNKFGYILQRVSLRKDGTWHTSGIDNCRVHVNVKEPYLDSSF